MKDNIDVPKDKVHFSFVYLDDVDSLDGDDTEDDVDAELDVDTLQSKSY